MALIMAAANSHCEQLSVVSVRAYSIGQYFQVEMEVCLPPEMTVEVAHSIALDLQQKVCGVWGCSYSLQAASCVQILVCCKVVGWFLCLDFCKVERLRVSCPRVEVGASGRECQQPVSDSRRGTFC